MSRTSLAQESFKFALLLKAVKSISPSGRYVLRGTDPKVKTCNTESNQREYDTTVIKKENENDEEAPGRGSTS